MKKNIPTKTLKNPVRILMVLNYNTKIKFRGIFPKALEPRTDFTNQNIPKSVLGQILDDLERDGIFRRSKKKISKIGSDIIVNLPTEVPEFLFAESRDHFFGMHSCFQCARENLS